MRLVSILGKQHPQTIPKKRQILTQDKLIKEYTIIGSIASNEAATVADHFKVLGSVFFQKVLLALIFCYRRQHFIKDVKVALAGILMYETHFFQKVGINGGPDERAGLLELKFNEFSKARGIVVTNSAGVTKCFQDRVGLEN